MNSIKGQILAVNTSGNLSLISVGINEKNVIKAIVIDTPETAPYLVKNKVINVLFKETEVVIGLKTNHQISLQNRIEGVVKQIKKGVLLSRIVVQTGVGDIVSIISADAVKQLSLTESVEVIVMIKLNEIMISE